MYFSDSQESRTANTYLFNFLAHFDLSNRNNFSFYYVFQHNASTNNDMTINFRWDFYNQPAGISVVRNIYIYIYTNMHTMCSPGCYHNGFMATPELGHRMYGYTLLDCIVESREYKQS